MLAGSIAYFFIMSVFPFSLFLVSIFGYFLGENREFYDFLLKELMRFLPQAASEITRELGTLITYQRIGLLTLIIYGLFSYQLFMALERAVNLIFKQGVKRPLFISVALSFVVVTLIIALLTLSFGATSAISMLKFLTRFFPKLMIKTITKILIGFVVPLFLVSMIATSLYILLPKAKVMIPPCPDRRIVHGPFPRCRQTSIHLLHLGLKSARMRLYQSPTFTPIIL